MAHKIDTRAFLGYSMIFFRIREVSIQLDKIAEKIKCYILSLRVDIL